ncbi:MAG: choice-of-anchor J domain-containing protein [Thermoflexales bacterium]|nr:choice-of-anchor J domain-containing protein [Thermoflexales bacterium]
MKDLRTRTFIPLPLAIALLVLCLVALLSASWQLQGAPGAYAASIPQPDFDVGALIEARAPMTYGVRLSAGTTNITGLAGSTVTYSLTLANTGTETDTFDLSTFGSEWSMGGVPPTIGPLGAGESFSFYVTITIPISAIQGDYDRLEVGVLSQGNPFMEVDSLVLTTVASSYAACTLTFLDESFESGFLPQDWSIVDYAGSGGVWRFDNPDALGNLSGGSGGFAVASSYFEGAIDMDTTLSTPSVDLSSASNAILLFASDFYVFLGNTIADVDVSIDGGSNWVNVWQQTSERRGPAFEAVDISTLAAGVPDVKIRFHYYNANDEWWWQIDDVRLVSCFSYGVELAPATDAKSGDPGTTVLYTLQVTNTGNTIDTFSLEASDNFWPAGLPATVGPLAAGASASFDVAVTVPQDAAAYAQDSITIIVRSQGEAGQTAHAGLTTTANAVPELSLAKLPEEQLIYSGGTASFTLHVTNTGNVSLTNVTLSDPASPDCGATLGTLLAGASRTRTCTMSGVTSDSINVATVTGTSPLGEVGAADSASVILSRARIAVTLQPERQVVLSGDDAHLTAIVTNTGEVNLGEVDLTFLQGLAALPECTPARKSLAAAASRQYTCTAPNVTADFFAQVELSAQAPGLGTLSASDIASVTTVLPASIGSQVWHDADADGVQDVSESAIPTVTVSLYGAGGNFVAETQTGLNGTYTFTALSPGSYLLAFQAPPGAHFSSPGAGRASGVGNNADPSSGQTPVFTLTAGAHATTLDAGLYWPVTLGDLVWEDIDADGLQDAGEPGLASVTLKLYAGGGSLITHTQTNRYGEYAFKDLAPGAYAVEVIPPTGFGFSPQDAGSDEALDSDVSPATGRTALVNLAAGSTLSLDAGLTRPSVQFQARDVGVPESAGSALVTVTLSATSTVPITVSYATILGTGSATAADVTPVDGQLVFAPGQWARNLSIPILDDGDYEQDETLLITLDDAVNARLGDSLNLTLHILNDDLYPETRQVLPCILDYERGARPNRIDVVDIQLAASRLNQSPLLLEHDIDGNGLVSAGEIQAVAYDWRAVCDNRQLAWAQYTDASSRHILLRWRWDKHYTGPNTTFHVYRRPVGAPAYSLIAQVRFAQDAGELASRLPSSLRNHLMWMDLEDAHLADDVALYDLLRSQYLTRTALLAENYHELAQAVGLGYIDSNPPLGPVEYYVVPAGQSWPVHGPAVIKPDAKLPVPKNLRQGTVFDGPGQLGTQNSTRPFTATERYNWDVYQAERAAHGSAFLLWDLPTEADQRRARSQSVNWNVNGYRVERRGPATGTSWEAVNPYLSTLGDYRLIRPGVPQDIDDPNDEAFVEDEVARVYAGLAPNLIYANYDYRVCPVDLLGNVGICSDPIPVPIRELDSPAPVHDLQIAVAPNHSVLTLTWSYSDVTEVSTPLRMFVSRSPTSTATAPITQWVELAPQGIPLANAAPTATLELTDTPPVGQQFWYRVQVRDNAGNWSATSAPVKGAVYTRTPPSLVVPFRPDCSNTLPMTLTTGAHFGPQVRQIILYRSFEPITTTTLYNRYNKPFQLIRRIRVQAGAAVLDDKYLPPYPATVYYMIEAVDGYGNVSLPQVICTRRNPGTPPDAPAITGVGAPVQVNPDDNTRFVIPLQVSGPQGGVIERQAILYRPSATAPGSVAGTTPTPVTGTHNITIENGETVELRLVNTNLNGDSAPVTKWLRKVNNFMDTERQMTNLGKPVGVEWAPGPTPAARLHFRGQSLDETPRWEPWVALYRQVPGGNWMQVTPAQDLAQVRAMFDPGTGPVDTWVVSDTSDPSSNQEYVYMALAFSPHSYEVLGYWQPITLTPLATGPEAITLTAPLAPAPTFTSTCSYDDRSPTYYGWPEQIDLPEGWVIHVDAYRDYGGCDGLVLSPDHLYGYGWLSNSGAVNKPVDFVDVSVDGGWVLVGGRIVAMLDESYTSLFQLQAHYGRIEISPDQARAEITLTLPARIQVLDRHSQERSRKVFGVFDRATQDLAFGPLVIDTAARPIALIDENLPWQIDAPSFSFTDSQVTPNGATTGERLRYAPYPIPGLGDTFLPTPDNNLALLRGSYASLDAQVTWNGLQGTFTGGALEYSTSLPAAAVVRASGATVHVAGSGIVSGTLENASVRVDYASQGTDLSFMSEHSRELRIGFRGPDPAKHIHRLESDNSTLAIGPNGLVAGAVAISPAELTWTGAFSVPTGLPDLHVTFYAAGASFSDSAWAHATSAPSPAENSWRRLPGPISGSDLDPGLNINTVHKRADYGCFRPSTFNDVDLDLYVRRGGVSENLRINTDSFGEIRDENGYLVTLKKYDLLFVDNSIVDQSDARLDLRLPYPSDVLLPLQVSEFDARGCPSGGQLGGGLTLNHKYWAFQQTPVHFFLWPITHTQALQSDYIQQFRDNNPGTSEADALAALPPRILVLQGQASINGLGKQTTVLDETGQAVQVPIVSHWFPNGDYGDIHPYPESGQRDQLPNYFRVSGIPYAVRDVKLSHYYSRLIDENSLPDTLGLELDDTVQSLPKELLDPSGKLTPASLKSCAQSRVVGCGFVLVDGNGAVDYFGEVEPRADVAGTPAQFEGDETKGDWPVATTQVAGKPRQATAEKPELTWAYPLVDEYLDLPIPVKFLANSAGGAFAGVWPDVTLLPGAEVIKTDLALVSTVNFSGSFRMDFGIFAGYTASQAAFRALAMNRPQKDAAGVKPYQDWAEVEEDITAWAKKFEYSIESGDTDDPVDLAKKTWSSWGSRGYDQAYYVLESTVRELKGKEAYGITGLQSGQVLKDAGATLATGLGQVVFEIAGSDFRMNNLVFGLMVDVRTGSGGSSSQQHMRAAGSAADKTKTNDALLHADWIKFEINRDGEIFIEGKNVSTALTGNYDIHADIYLLIGTKAGNQRIEGGITIAKLDLSSVVFRNIGAVFGAGFYNYQPLFYLGLKGEGDFSNYRVGAAILFGLINPDSKVLKAAGFAELLAKIGSDGVKSGMQSPSPGTFAGIYLAVWGDVPIYNYSCIVNVTASAEVRFWYFTPTSKGDPIYGGYLRGSVYGTGLCLIHARGELTLSIERLRNTGTSWGGRKCSAPGGCMAFSGEFWIAVGIGFCEPKNWVGWKNRWWNDDMCYTAGVQAEVSYIDPPDGKDWDAALHPDAE